MSDLPPPPQPPPPPPPPGYTVYGEHRGLQMQLAGFWIRFAALLLDGIIIGIPVWILGALTGAYTTTSTDAFGNEVESTNFQLGIGFTPGVPFWFNLLSTAIGVAYYASLEGGPTGQTLGKRVCGIRVVDADNGQPGIGLGRGIGRYFARWLSSIPLGLGYFWMLWDQKNQCWHDKLVNDLVVKT